MSSKRILIVDDEIAIREMLKVFLKNKDYTVYEAKNGLEALNRLEVIEVDVILLDIEMPQMDGFQVCQSIREKMNIPIIFLSVRRDVMDKVKCLELGGDDYITKPFDYTELDARISAVLRRYHFQNKTNKDEIVIDDLKVDLQRYECFLKGKPVNLSTKEMQLLLLMLQNPERIWSSEQIYDQIWGYDSIGDIQTVKVHISNLRKKLETNPSKPKYIKTIRGFGYLFSKKQKS